MTSINSISKVVFQWWEKGSALNPMLPTGLLVLILSLVAAIWWLVGSIKGRQKSKVVLPPGPPGLPFLGTLPFIDPELHRYFAALARTYGPIVSLRLGSRLCVVIGSVSVAKEILRDQDTTFANQGESARNIALRNGEQGLGWGPYNSHWRHIRKLAIGEMLSSGKLDALSPDLRRREVSCMVKHVHAQIGTPVAFKELMFVALSNVITGMLWGGTLEEKEMGRVGEELRPLVKDVLQVFARFDVFEFFPALASFDILGMVRRIKKLATKIQRIFDAVIDRRLEMDRLGEEGRGKDLLQVFTKTMEEEDPKAPLTRSHIKSLFTDLIMAGVDTSMRMIAWVMAETLNNPEVVKKAQDELQQVVGSGNTVEEIHLPKLHYLKAIVKEALRLHPAVPLMLPRTPTQSSTVGGYFVPAGSLIFVNVWAIQRDPKAWDNPTAFQPERFLAAGGGVGDFSGNDFRYFPFGSGRRICAGISLADQMLAYVLGTLLHSFEWRLPEGSKPDLTEKFGLTLKMAKPFVAIALPRVN